MKVFQESDNPVCQFPAKTKSYRLRTDRTSPCVVRIQTGWLMVLYDVRTFAPPLLINFPVPKPEGKTLKLTPFFKSLLHIFCGDGFASMPFIRDSCQRR